MGTAAAGSIPPFVVEDDEVRLPGRCAFSDACFVEVRPICEPERWRAIETLLTLTRDWGLVWRTDFSDSRGSPTRIICWQPPNERIQIALAVATELPRLRGAGSGAD